ncbi:MAG TPA: amidohydrolase family protein [Candidatus Binataceae bacterium]|nr:amidohydrolase family protein [Candidatus Binataceae bacterium]
MKIDFHCHAFPADFFAAMKRHYPDAIEIKQDAQGRMFAVWANTPLPAWDHAARVEDIDRAGIDIEILSNPPIYSRIDDHTPELCRMVNDALAASCRRDPDRFKALAHLPFNSLDAAMNEMARALDQLGCVGVLVTSNIAGRYLDTPEFLPFWSEINRRQAPVFMHPANSPSYRDDQPPTLLSFPFDTTLSAHKLVSAGLFERFPDLTLVLAHLGGALPYLSRRIDIAYDTPGFYGSYPKPARRPSEHMSKLYVDTALGWNRGAFECAREMVGVEHILFGTDYFMGGTPFMERTREFIDSLGLKPSEREMIYCENAARILKLRV